MLLIFSLPALALESQENLNKLIDQLCSLEKNNDEMSSEEITKSYLAARQIALDNEQDPETRIRANLVYSGFLGIYAQKNLSRKHGKQAFMALKENFNFSADNKVAAIAYANAVIFISNKGWVVRKLISSGLGINLQQELSTAKTHLAKIVKDNQVSTKLNELEKIYL